MPLDELDDRGVAAGILDREVHGGLVAMRLHHHDLDGVEQRERFLDGSGVVEQELRPQPGVDARLAWIAGAEVGRVEVEHVGAEAALVEPVGGADAVDRRDEAAVLGRPAGGFSFTTTSDPARPPSRFMPRGKTVRTGSVDSGQSMVRPTTTASLLSFHKMREQAWRRVATREGLRQCPP